MGLRQEYADFLAQYGQTHNRCSRRYPFVCRYAVGIGEDDDFRVVQKLLGRGAANKNSIISEASKRSNGAPVEIRIRGRTAARGSGGDPLKIIVGAGSKPALEITAEMIEELLADVHEQYRKHCRERGVAVP